MYYFLEKIDAIKIEPIHNSTHLFSSDVFFGNYMNNGKYQIYMNMSEQDFGYYELRCKDSNSNTPESVSSFIYTNISH